MAAKLFWTSTTKYLTMLDVARSKMLFRWSPVWRVDGVVRRCVEGEEYERCC